MKARRSSQAELWSDDAPLMTVARNVSTRYLAIGIDTLIGILLLPFNIRHLGQSAYGLWMLTASMMAYFSVLDLGFGGSMVKFIAMYRARRDAKSLNEIASTLFVIFGVCGLVAYAIFVALALNIGRVFNLTPDQMDTGRSLLLIVGVYVSLGFPFSVFGGVINGFQRYDLNNAVGIASSLVVAAVNVAMLLSGATLVQLVAATTVVRILAYFVYRLNAYLVFPPLSLRPSLFRWSRVHELTAFSVYVAIIDWSNKLNYSIDAFVIGAFLSPAAVAIWTVPQRIAEGLQRLTNQLNGVLFPLVVDSDVQRPDRLRAILVHGTRLSLAGAMPLAAALFLLAAPLIRAWVGPRFDDSIAVAEILIVVVAIRVGNATATTLLKGAGRHRLLSWANAGAAVANLALSLLWIRRYGLVGQAMGTLVPVAATSIFVLWPAACRRVGLGVIEAARLAVWPTVWPTAVMALVIIPLREAVPSRLIGVAALGAVGALCYAVTFLAFAITRSEREAYLAKANEIVRLRRRLAAAA
ncbi:MAG TPA: oligosaccharide flippase family protein [Vicinamibacterales bacterium]|nr:oligosaccharide flippase family protein [Vicinamibacterales bacterium]